MTEFFFSSQRMQFSSITNTGLDLQDKCAQSGAWTAAGLELTGAAGCRSFLYSKCGRFLAQAVGSTVSILSCAVAGEKEQVALIPDIKVLEMDFSPQGTFIATFQRWEKTADAGTT